jgi:hypothetical protein
MKQEPKNTKKVPSLRKSNVVDGNRFQLLAKTHMVNSTKYLPGAIAHLEAELTQIRFQEGTILAIGITSGVCLMTAMLYLSTTGSNDNSLAFILNGIFVLLLINRNWHIKMASVRQHKLDIINFGANITSK